MTEYSPNQEQLDVYIKRALGVAGAALTICAIWIPLGSEQAFRSYLLGFIFWTEAALGCLGLLMLHHLVGGLWGFTTQRFLESGARMILLMAILAVPLFFGLHHIYEWARPEAVALDPILQEKSPYLNVGGFVGRTAAYFVLWSLWAVLLTRWSRQLDKTGDPSIVSRLKSLSGPGLPMLVLTVSFASIDWMMSLEPHWYSSIYGFIFLVGSVLLGLAWTILVLTLMSGHEPFRELVALKKPIHDLGNLLMAFVLLWTYVTLSQFLIIYSGNLPEEIVWYTHRTGQGWTFVALLIAVFHFAVPFLVLLSRQSKRHVKPLMLVAGVMFAMRFVELFWLVVPGIRHGGALALHPMDLFFTMGIGGLWVAGYFWQLKGMERIVPDGDPRFAPARNAAAH